jgi:hypothetical protein
MPRCNGSRNGMRLHESQQKQHALLHDSIDYPVIMAGHAARGKTLHHCAFP